MKKVIILILVFFSIPILASTQNIKFIDYISPFHEGIAAIKKGNQWALINTEGVIIVNFRNDLVSTKSNTKSYPKFINERCLITLKRDGISYFGYIDKSGKSIIEPSFLNATNYNHGFAIALELAKEDIGKNQLNKDVYYYKYFEVLIDKNGKIIKYLEPDNATYVALDKSKLLQPPIVTSKVISRTLYGIYDKNKKWTILKI